MVGVGAGTSSADLPLPVVVTRLAVRTRAAASAPDEQWVRARVDLLRQIGWPSLRRAGVDLAWVLVVDPDRFELARDLTADLTLPVGSTHLARGVGFAPVTDELELESEVRPDRHAFVTIRMDSDDALLPGTVDAVVHAAAAAADQTLVDLPHGYQLDLGTGRLVEAMYHRWRQGPFLAIVHHRRESMLDTGGEHTGARGDRPVVRIDDPAWVQTIHGTNVSNAVHAVPLGRRLTRAARAAPSGAAATALRHGRVLGRESGARVLARAGIELRG